LTDLFNDDDTQIPAIAQVDPDKDYLAELVGEGKKFAEVSDLARGKAESDAFIEQLKQENATFRDKLQEATTYESLMNELKSTKTNDNPLDNPNSQNNHSDETDNRESVNVTQDQFDTLLEQKLQERQSQTDRTSNVRKVSDALTTMFGDGAQAALRTIGETNGLSTEQLKELAAQQPQVVLNLAKGQPTPQTPEPSLFSDTTPRPTTGDFRSSTVVGLKNQAYYNKMRERDPKKYFSADTEMEMHREAVKDPDRFFNN